MLGLCLIAKPAVRVLFALCILSSGFCTRNKILHHRRNPFVSFFRADVLIFLDVSTQQCPSETTMESSSSQLQNDQESSVAKDHSLEEREDSNEASINSKNECYFQESQSLFSDNSESTLCQTYEKPTQEIDQSQLATKQDVPSQIAAANAMSSSERTILGFPDVSQELACNPEDSNIDSQKKAILDKESGIPSKSANASDGTIVSEIETNNDREENVVEKNPNVKGSLLKRSFATTRDEIRYKTIVDRCMSAFAVCLKRFPEHYKSQYKIAYVATYFETHRVSFHVLLCAFDIDAND